MNDLNLMTIASYECMQAIDATLDSDLILMGVMMVFAFGAGVFWGRAFWPIKSV